MKDRRLPLWQVWLISLVLGPALAFALVWFQWPWIFVEMTGPSNVYRIAGCANQPAWIYKGSVYDCYSSTRQRYEKYIQATGETR